MARGALSPAGGDARLVVGGRVARAAARSGALWGCVFGLFVVVQTVAFTAQYDTQAARDQMAATYGTEGGLTAVLGQPDALNTVAGWATWRFVGILGLLGSVWGVLLVTRLLRGEEESGRWELLLTGQTTPRRAAGQAATIAAAVLGIGYALRMAANTDRGLHWLGWLSPLGWVERIRPLNDPNPVAVVPVLALTVGATAAAVWLAGRRDAGTAILPERHAGPPRVALLGGPVRFAVRQTRLGAAGWLFAIAAFAALFGVVADSSTQDVDGSRDIEEAISRLGGHGSPTAVYLGLIFLVVSFLVALIAAGQVSTLRAEEAAGQLDALLVRPVSRARWLAGRLAVSCLLLGCAGVAAGGGAWVGTAGQSDGIGAGDLVTAGVNIVPPGLFLLGLGTLVFGGWPRATRPVVYAYLTWAFLIEFSGGAVRLHHWLLDTSVFFDVSPAPAGPPDWSSAAVLSGLGIAGAVLGGFLFRRRDLRAA
ncbi:putative exporter of polyketide antibiotics-like protein [Parafrankia sp. Ea1.12]|uniref:hypothetical protein n=1 Tax=Parafrankia sp. Ea1.12 TaxID=573499 RepID=UPI000DA4F7CB|nr:hypothetical protein [Parafrankia sp. Ea1.12]SQE00525.1 putative exporter of polyketide antibiotics-like protein [Parafrankia sp. Ea1.12]